MNNSCKTCGKSCDRQWCSQLCHARFRRTGEDRQCKGCGNTFYASGAEIKRNNGLFCSIPCRRKYKAEHARAYLKKGRKSIHRIVAEQKLGRPLQRGEVVHHIDGNRHNNHPDNLMVLPSQSAHMKEEFASGRLVVTHEQAVSNGKRSGEVRRAKSRQKALNQV
jgi:hypothetical protein